MTLKQKFLLGAIVCLAIFFRFYQISQMPGGLFPDEAANGLDINLMQSGDLQPFYERGNGREALFFYMLWGSVALFGKVPWAHHLVSALVGVLSVVVCFLVTRKLFSFNLNRDDEGGQTRATYIALLATFLMAVSTWHTVLSRTAFRANLIPLFATLTFYFLLLTYQASEAKKKWLFAFLTGASFALGFYTYIAFRIMVPAVLVLILWPAVAALREKQLWMKVKEYFLPAVFLLLAGLIFIFPLAKYFYEHPGSFVGRSGQVSIFNPELYLVDGIQLHGKPPLGVVLAAAAEVTKVSLMGYITHGDLNWRHNISGQPFLSALYSPFFVVGLMVVTFLGTWYFFAPSKRKGFWPFFFLSVWFWGMLLPVVSTAEGIPHGLRSIGTIPVVFIISAWTLYEFAMLVAKAHKKLWSHVMTHYKNPKWAADNTFMPPQMRLVNGAFKLLVAVFILGLVGQSYFLYFVYANNSPENFYYFRSDLTSVSKYLVDRCNDVLSATGQSNKAATYLVLDKFSVQTTDYLTSDPKGNFSSPCNVPYLHVDPENSWELKNLKPGDEVVFAQSSVFDARKFVEYHKNFHLSLEFRNKFNQSIMAVYKIKSPASKNNAKAVESKEYSDCIEQGGKTGIISEAAYCKINNQYYYAPVPAGAVN